MIREATTDDIDRVVTLAQDFIGGTAYRTLLPARPGAIRTFAERMVTMEDSVILLHQDREMPDGMLALWVYAHPYTGDRVATELAWWVDPARRGVGVKLLRCGESWSRSKGAKLITMIAPNEHVAQFYRRVGYEYVESNYQRSL